MALLLTCRAASVACACSAGPRHGKVPTTRHTTPAPLRRHPVVLTRAEGESEGGATPGVELENPDSEVSRKKAAADRLRAAERFMVVGTGEATCGGCGFEYTPKAGDPEYPVPPGTMFRDLPADWGCPVCGAGKSAFRSRAKEIAGFEQNQGYGLGTNALTGGQKSGLIYGGLVAFFLLFIGGYFLE